MEGQTPTSEERNTRQNFSDTKEATQHYVGSIARVATMTPPQSKLAQTLFSKVRFRILKLLTESLILTADQIETKLGINYVATRKHLNALENADVLTHANFGKRVRYYRFKESAKANAVKNLIEAWSFPE
jgi:response regulator of citrate/malate metabolism